MRSWTIPRKFRNAFAALALASLLPLAAHASTQTDPQALARKVDAVWTSGAAAGWHYGDFVAYFAMLLDAGRAYALTRPDDPENLELKGIVVDLASRYHYDPLIDHDASEWYVRLAAAAYADDPTRGAAARALLQKLDADDADPARLAQDADADATANATSGAPDAAALLEQVDADVGAFFLTKDPRYRSLALLRASQPAFPIALVPDDLGQALWTLAGAARSGASGYSAVDRAAAIAMYSHAASAKDRGAAGLTHAGQLVMTAPADEYFGRTKLSPLGVRDALIRIGKYLDAGWGDRMTKDALWVVDSLEDWQHQYPRDYELPRLLLQTYQTLQRIDSPDAKKAEADVRRTLTVEYNDSAAARSLLTAG